MNKSIVYLFLIIFGCSFFTNCKSGSTKTTKDLITLAQEYNTPYPAIDNLETLNYKGLKEESKDAYFKGMRAYKNGNWQACFNNLFRINPKTDVIMLYEANSQLQLGAYSKSKEILTTLLSVTRGTTKMNAEWYMVITDLGLKDKAAALMGLKPILQNPAHPYHEQGKALMKDLK